MFDISLLDRIIKSDKVQSDIYNECNDQFRLSFELQSFVEEKIISSNKDIDMNNYNHDVDLSIKSLFSQAIKTYKSSILLIQNGYITNSLVNTRNLVEITFNIKYILFDKDLMGDRAKLYLYRGRNRDTNMSVFEKSMISLDTYLYRLYSILCEYSHGNFKATEKNIEDNLFSTYPTSKLSYDTINLVNSIYIHCINSVCDYMGVDNSLLNSINKPESVTKLVNNLSYEKNILTTVQNVIRELCEKEGNSNCNHNIDVIQEFNEYRKEKNKKHRRKKQKISKISKNN